MPTDREGLPQEFADQFTRSLRRFLKIESPAGVLLLIATVVALVVSNSALAVSVSAFWESSAGFHFGSFEWINDGLMTLFFFVVALELKRELVSGSLRKAAFPLAGALGGMIVPPAIYLAMLHGAPGSRGWGTPISTDSAWWLGATRNEDSGQSAALLPRSSHTQISGFTSVRLLTSLCAWIA